MPLAFLASRIRSPSSFNDFFNRYHALGDDDLSSTVYSRHFELADFDVIWENPTMNEATMLMTCPHCRGVLIFERHKEGEETNCYNPNCQRIIRLKADDVSKHNAAPLSLIGWITWGLICYGTYFIIRFTFFYSISNPGEDVVNLERMHIRLCWILVGIGLDVVGGIGVALYCLLRFGSEKSG